MLRALSVMLIIFGVIVGVFFLVGYDITETSGNPSDVDVLRDGTYVPRRYYREWRMHNRYLGSAAGAFMVATGIAVLAITSRQRV